MGAVQAKSFEAGPAQERQQREEDIVLEDIKAKVDRVHIDGLGRTKDDFIIATVKELFNAQDFKQVILGVNEVRNRLESLGIFKNVNILIDTSKGQDAHPDGLDITFFVKESSRITGGVTTLVGNNEGSLVVGLRLPNVLGRAEKIQMEYAYGSKRSAGMNLTLTKPYLHPSHPIWTSALFQQSADIPFSGFSESDVGVLTEISFNSTKNVRHNLRYEGVWRDLSILPSTRSFAIREEMGHSFKSALKYTASFDVRDDSVLPTRGSLLRFNQEFAGLGGDVGFQKSEIECQTNAKLPLDCVLQGSLNLGGMKAYSNDKSYNIADRFFLGGPLTLRGFETRGAGPHSESSATGCEMFWSAAAHLYTPLPFRPLRGGLGENFRLHFFANTGNIGRFSIAGNDLQQFVNSLLERRRLTVGGGLVVRLGSIARLEINYCVPMSLEAGDRANHGLQFGFGVHYY
ncbi:hypothetical protein CHUAL_001011 [Chamberlinius hualienensis]